MPGDNLLIEASCVLVLVLLAARVVLRLERDRRNTGGGSGTGPAAAGDHGADRRRHHRGEAAHLAMALGMALMFLPFRADRPVLAGLFGAIVLFAAAVWVTDRVRSVRVRSRRGAAGCGCAPEHRLEPHHVVVGSAMAVMALGSRTVAVGAGMAAMPGMALGSGASPGPAALILFGYVWLSVLVLGGGLARALRADPGPDRGVGALLGAPGTVYACELAMTVVMGLMLLS